MAAYHARSISLPSRSHPLIPQFNEHLNRVNASEATPSSLSSIGNRLSALQRLYDCVDDSLSLPHTQQILAQECNQIYVGEVLDGYLKLLDVCNISKEVLTQEKEDLQQLLSILRRRRNSNDLDRYLTSKKKANKATQKILKSVKSSKSKYSHETIATVCMLNEAERATHALFESLLSYIAGTDMQSKPSSWSLVSKLMHSRKEAETERSELQKAKAALHSLVNQRTGISDIENVQKQLQNLESSIQDLEEGLDSLFRRLIKTRVSLLNILNH